MKNSPNSNMYMASADIVWEKYDGALAGCYAGLWCVVSDTPLTAPAKNALEKSAEALGYKKDACTYVVLARLGELAGARADASESATINGGASANANMDTNMDESANASASANANTLFEIVEGIDPLCVVATDVTSIQTLGATYTTRLTQNTYARLFGRDCVTFRDFSGMMNSPESKQRAWALLKKLPHLK